MRYATFNGGSYESGISRINMGTSQNTGISLSGFTGNTETSIIAPLNNGSKTIVKPSSSSGGV
ncbi:hypothetical protein ACHAWO_011868 [Cyclotella atomus]|uniref:Uncharacterized protein n=1 Tax=Cyclotella atomus TaxID=382360 RepID=A0ABD3NJ03_9STRA